MGACVRESGWVCGWVRACVRECGWVRAWVGVSVHKSGWVRAWEGVGLRACVRVSGWVRACVGSIVRVFVCVHACLCIGPKLVFVFAIDYAFIRQFVKASFPKC